MGRLDGRVALVTGAGRGLGRAHSLALAAEGASVLVNDLGVERDGSATDETPADAVVAEIEALGGAAAVSNHDVSDWAAAGNMVESAIEVFGGLDIVVNNAGILRDRAVANVSEQEWDDVIRIHLKGHAATTHHAMSYWRDRSKAEHPVSGSVVCTASVAGLFPNFGQTAYAAAKAAIAAFAQTVALEGARYGVRANVVVPSAQTRLIAGSAVEIDESASDAGGGDFDMGDPANVSPLVVWLAGADCPANGQIFGLFGNRLGVYRMGSFVGRFHQEARWTPEQMDDVLPGALVEPFTAEDALNTLLSPID